MMNIKLRAFLYAAGVLLGGSLAGVVFVQLLAAIPLSWWPWIGISALIGMGFYVIYSITLYRLEYEARLKEVAERK